MPKHDGETTETTENVWGERIKTLRQELGLTQTQFADRLGKLKAATTVSGATVNRWEKGKIPQGKHWQALLELANEEDFLRNFTGQDLRDVYLKKFHNDRDYLPEEGALGFLETRLKEADDFQEVLGLIWKCKGSLKRAATVEGRAADEKTQEEGAENPRTYILFTLPDHEKAMEFREKVKSMACMIKPRLELRFSPKEVLRS